MGTSSVNGSFNWRIYENPILELWFAGKIIKLNVWLSNLPCLITTWYTFLVVKLRKWCGAYDGVYNMNTSMTWRYCDENIPKSLTSCELQGHGGNGRTIMVSKANAAMLATSTWLNWVQCNPFCPQVQRMWFCPIWIDVLGYTSF